MYCWGTLRSPYLEVKQGKATEGWTMDGAERNNPARGTSRLQALLGLFATLCRCKDCIFIWRTAQVPLQQRFSVCHPAQSRRCQLLSTNEYKQSMQFAREPGFTYGRAVTPGVSQDVVRWLRGLAAGA